MIELTPREDFFELAEETRRNVFVFYKKNCHSCELYDEELKKYDTKYHFYRVEAMKDEKDTDFYLDVFGSGFLRLPRTIITDDNAIIFDDFGVLYEPQMNKLFSILNYEDETDD